VRKLGDRVLGRIIPILKEGVLSDSTTTRRGVCAGIKEVRGRKAHMHTDSHMHECVRMCVWMHTPRRR